MLSAKLDINSNLATRWARNEKEDLFTAIGYLYEFKEKLSHLNPNITNIISGMFDHIHEGSN